MRAPGIETSAVPRVVIVGSGFGGLAAARALAHARASVLVVDRRNHHLFQPLLYQVATAALSPGDIAYPIRSILRRQRNADVRLAEAVGVDVARRELVLADGRVPYDFLVIATGATHAYFGHPEWEERAPGLKSIEDALEIRRRILSAFERADREPDPEKRRALVRFAVIGGGPTGVELAGAIAEISRQVLVDDFRHLDPREARIVLVEGGSRLLPAYAPQSSARAERALRERGVEVRTGAMVTAVDGDGIVAGGERIPAATLLWAAGVAPSPLVRDLGVALDRAGRARVERDFSIPGHPEVFVIGDVADYAGEDGRPLPGLCPVALQEGRWVGRAIAARLEGRTVRPFRYLDKGILAVIGRASAIGEIAGLRLWGLPAWLVWCFVHIFFLIGFRNRFVVMFEWAWAYLTFKRGARLITEAGGARLVTEPGRPPAEPPR